MTVELRQSTAVVIFLGPGIDDTDGKTLEDGLDVTTLDIQIMQPLVGTVVPPDLVTNGAFGADSDWTKNSWTISAGVANSAAAQDTNLDQTITLTENVAYEITFEVKTVSAGSVTPIIGGTSGTARTTAAIFTETIVAGSGSLIRFDAIGFTGTIDDVVIKQAPIPITPTASGGSNDMVLTQSNTGSFYLEVTANQVAILGNHMVTAFVSGVLIVWKDFAVITQNAWDSKFGSDKLQVDVQQVNGTAQTAGDLAALINTVDDLLDTEVAAIKTVVDGIQTDLDNGTDGLTALAALINGLNDISVANILAVAQTESYAADGATATVNQLLYMILALVSEFSIASTTITTKKLDGSTTAMTHTLDSATSPTSRTRAT